MSEACGWKYRRANLQVQAIHDEEGLGFEQIRSWMANNKPPAFKRPPKKVKKEAASNDD